MFSRPAHLLIPIFAAQAFAQAETTTPAAPADFTAGLKQLAELGVPDVTGAKWVAAGPSVANQLRSGGYDQDDYRTQEVLGPVAQNLWLFPAVGDAAPMIMFAGTPGAMPAEMSSRLYGAMPAGQAEMIAMMRKQLLTQLDKASPAKLAEDVDAVIGRMDKKLAESRKQMGDNENPWQIQQEAGIGGRMLIFAAQVYRAGDAVAANKLAAAIFQNFPKREIVLNAAISGIADKRYFAACDAFEKDGDWARYAKSIKEVCAKFPRGWESRPAVVKLLALVEARVAGGAGKIVLPAGVKGDAPTLAALEALGANKLPKADPSAASSDDARGGLWILPALPTTPGNRSGGVYYGSNYELMYTPAVKALVKSGFAALPALAAAAGDETLTPLFRSNGGHSYSSNESPEEKTKRLFNEIRRPMTRGEIVRSLLDQILPGEEYNRRSLEADAFAESVETFRTEHEKDTPVALASFYLKDGSHQQKRAAMVYISRSEDPAAGKAFEDTLLEAEDVEGRLSEALEYLRVKRAKAAGFAQKLVAKLKENLALPDERPAGENSSRSTGGVTRLSKKRLENQIKAVEAFASGKSVREMMMEAAAKPAKEAMPLLNAQSQSLREMPIAERVPLTLEVACTAKDNALKSWCVQQLGAFNYFGAESAEKYAVPAPGSPEAKRWLELFSEDKTEAYPGVTLGLMAAASFESLCDTPSPVAMLAMRKPGKSGKSADNIFLRRAKARLAGQAIPAYPDPTKVSKERLTAIVATVSTTPDEKLEDYLDTLNADERVAWTVWWSFHLSPESAAYMKVTLPEVAAPAAFKEREKRLSSVASNSMMGAVTEDDKTYTKTLLAAVGLAPGEVVDAGRVEAACAALAKDAAKHSGSFLMITRGESSLGLAPHAHREKIAPVAKEESSSSYGMASLSRRFAMQLKSYAQRFMMEGDYGYKDADAVVVLQMPGAGSTGERVWRVKDGKVTAPEALDAKLAQAPVQYASIVVLTAKDAAVIVPKEKAGEPADDDGDDGEGMPVSE